MATIRALFNYLEFEDKISANPLRKMRIKIKEPNRLPNVMDIKEIRRIFNSAYEENYFSDNRSPYENFEIIRNIVVVELLFATGARVSELANLKVDCIDTTTGSITIKGKGNKERIIQVCNNESLKVLKEYHRMYCDSINNSGGYFLINRLGRKLSDQSIRMIVKKLASRAKLQKHVTPHVFRHTFATLLLEKEVDIKYIQSLLGHSSIMTTQIYTHVNREKQKKILRAKHPRKDFSMLSPLAS
jgi:integrase/recombinase XerD